MQDLTFYGGNEYRLRLVPQVHSVTKSFKALPLQTRGCRFMREQPEHLASVFTNYRFKSCVFNCMLENLVIGPK